MRKPKAIIVLLLTTFLMNLISEVSFAQASHHGDKRSRLIPTARPQLYVRKNRTKTHKYVYDMDTRHVTRAATGKLLPSQVGVHSNKVSKKRDLSVVLKEKGPTQNKRSIASKQ